MSPTFRNFPGSTPLSPLGSGWPGGAVVVRTLCSLTIMAVAFGLAMTGARADVILTVGAGAEYTTISAAVNYADNHASTYYDIYVAPGTYTNDFSKVTTPLTI